MDGITVQHQKLQVFKSCEVALSQDRYAVVPIEREVNKLTIKKIYGQKMVKDKTL